MVAHAAVHVYEMSIPLFVVAWLAEFQVVDLLVVQVDVTTATLGVIVTVGYGLFGAGALPSGVMVDRVGSRRLIAACLLGMGSAYVGLAFAPSTSAVALALAVWGAAASVYHPAGLALISKGVRERGRGLAYHGISGNLGIVSVRYWRRRCSSSWTGGSSRSCSVFRRWSLLPSPSGQTSTRRPPSIAAQ